MYTSIHILALVIRTNGILVKHVATHNCPQFKGANDCTIGCDFNLLNWYLLWILSRMISFCTYFSPSNNNHKTCVGGRLAYQIWSDQLLAKPLCSFLQMTLILPLWCNELLVESLATLTTSLIKLSRAALQIIIISPSITISCDNWKIEQIADVTLQPCSIKYQVQYDTLFK